MIQGSPYGWLMLAGIVVTICFWSRLARRDDRLLAVYLAALIGAFLGAKVVYILAEGWLHFGAPDMWLQLATGKSILGALLGGYVSVELAKKWVGYPGITGDWFASIAPLGIMIGRIGCLLHGCCLGVVCKPSWFALRDAQGVPRWPAVPVEIAFNLAALVVFFVLRRRHKMVGQHFHLYLMAYGAFRFLHEFVRQEPHILGPFSGYQIAALAVLALGVGGYIRRRRKPPAGGSGGEQHAPPRVLVDALVHQNRAGLESAESGMFDAGRVERHAGRVCSPGQNRAHLSSRFSGKKLAQ